MNVRNISRVVKTQIKLLINYIVYYFQFFPIFGDFRNP